MIVRYKEASTRGVGCHWIMDVTASRGLTSVHR